MNTIRLFSAAFAVIGAQAVLGNETGGSQSLELRYQTFGGVESTYRSYTYRAGNESGGTFHLKAVQSIRESTLVQNGNAVTRGNVQPPAGLGTGGNDLEFGFTLPLVGCDGSYTLGFAFPTTTADSSTSFVYGFSRAINDSLGFSIKGFSGATSANALFVNKTFSINDKLSLNAEVGSLITGYSTIDETTGEAKRNALVNARLNYQLSDMLNAFVGVSNTLGDSTRFSLNSSVGNKISLTFGIGGKF